MSVWQPSLVPQDGSLLNKAVFSRLNLQIDFFPTIQIFISTKSFPKELKPINLELFFFCLFVFLCMCFVFFDSQGSYIGWILAAREEMLINNPETS